MVFESLRSGLIPTDDEFDVIFPEHLQEIAAIHFTPVEVAKLAAQYLVDLPNTRVLDIGSGAGKFCMIGSVCTDGHFTGVEQRESFVSLANSLSKQYELSHIKFIHSNITTIPFNAFDAFYYFNSFYENIDQSGIIDTTIPLDKTLYHAYAAYVKAQLDRLPIGTKLVTYFSYFDEVPASYKIVSRAFDGKLIMRRKVS